MSNILTGAASTVPGFSSIPFDVGKGVSIVHFFEALGVQYGLGSKVDITQPLDRGMRFNVAPGKPRPSLDCSGMSRLLIYKCSGGVTIPDGSFVQNDWFAAKGFKHHAVPQANDPYYLIGLDSSYAYICFCKTGSRGESIGHVWILVFVNGAWWSLESHGGKGPDMRARDYPTLARICTDVYVLGKVA